MKETFPKNKETIESQELQNIQENKAEKSETKEVLKFILDDKEYELKTSSYNFEYPKNTQERTGIVGYERIKISAEDIFEFYKNYIKNMYNLDIEKIGVNQYTDIPQFMKDVYDFYHYKEGYYKDTSLPKRFNDLSNLISEDILYKISSLDFPKFLYKVFDNLSNKEYPYMCLNHKIGAYAGNATAKEYVSNFADDKFFLQKIYDIERIKEERKNKPVNQIFNHGQESFDYAYSDFFLYDKEKDSKIFEKGVHIGNITDYADTLGQKNYAVSGKGLDVSPGRFWHGVNITDTVLGFSPFNDLFFEEYSEKAAEILLSLKLTDSWDSAAKTSFALFLLNKYKKQVGTIKQIEEIASEFLLDKNLPTLEELSINIRDIIRRVMNNEGELGNNINEIKLPIFIGRDDIPQLSWGHAKYAHYFNEKGLNFFKFKHKEYLPEKNSINS